MAEYTYVDALGVKPLAMYLSGDEVEQAELSNSDLGRNDLVFALRHMQAHVPTHSLREVNEKLKNTRSRIVNWFGAMCTRGALPSSKPDRYVIALISALHRSPFLPSSPNRLVVPANKQDIDLWLDAMCWLHPRRMHAFLLACALNVARAHAKAAQTQTGMHTYAQHAVLGKDGSGSVLLGDVLAVLHQLVASLQGGTAVADLPSMEEYSGVRVSLDKASTHGRILCAGGTVSSDLFYTLDNKEKARLAGSPSKLLAAVGGVIRNNASTMATDIRLHMHRLWSCVARFRLISEMVSPLGSEPSAQFDEFVVVYDYMGAMDCSVEQHVRVAHTRMPCSTGRPISGLVAQYVASTAGERRAEIPVWLAIVAKPDGTHALALVICALHADCSSGMLGSRCFSDAEVDDARGMIGALPAAAYGGLEPWPWTAAQTTEVSMARQPIALSVCASAEQRSSVVVSGPTALEAHALLHSPWHEPRVLVMEAYTRQRGYAELAIVGACPSYAFLASTNARHKVLEKPMSVPIRASSASCARMVDQPLLVPRSYSESYNRSRSHSRNSSSVQSLSPVIATSASQRHVRGHHPYCRSPQS
ncbi:hypothetical protein EV175_005333 [Coemansia sp. RSA 1933]|nr:hypothetical protein EV175_005333 [Coemansia sp. RSA 1933]